MKSRETQELEKRLIEAAKGLYIEMRTDCDCFPPCDRLDVAESAVLYATENLMKQEARERDPRTAKSKNVQHVTIVRGPVEPS